MALIMFLLVFFVSEGVVCWNSTGGYMSTDEGDLRSRQSRLFNFNTGDDEIVVELDFAVPFIKIPVKKSVEMTKGAMANINLGALVLTGVLTFGAVVVVPALISILNTKLFLPHISLETSSYSQYRKSDSDMWRYLTILDNALMNINIDTTSCLQRTLCWTVKNSSRNVGSGNGSSLDKIIDGLASNEWLQEFMTNTPFYSAMKSGLDNLDCDKEYEKCTLTKRTLNMIIKKFVKMIYWDD